MMTVLRKESRDTVSQLQLVWQGGHECSQTRLGVCTLSLWRFTRFPTLGGTKIMSHQNADQICKVTCMTRTNSSRRSTRHVELGPLCSICFTQACVVQRLFSGDSVVSRQNGPEKWQPPGTNSVLYMLVQYHTDVLYGLLKRSIVCVYLTHVHLNVLSYLHNISHYYTLFF